MNAAIPADLRSTVLPRILLLSLLALFAIADALAQSSATSRDLSLDSRSAFASPADNWQIVRSVKSTRTVVGELETWPGIGVLANVPTSSSSADLATRFEHGDILLDLEVLVPHGTTSGILLQGRYEVSIGDSWGEKSPDAGQFGGIAGLAPPFVNVSRAPGLWQKLSVLFRAPRFDSSGRKTANAAFVRVLLNGVPVQEEIELDGPTAGAGAASAGSEAATGPLVFRGEGGPIAYRNIQYQTLDNGPVAIEGLRYDYYRGDFGWELPDLSTLDRKSGGPLEEITSAIADTVNRFAINFTGDLVLPATGVYNFEITYTGQFALTIDGETVVDIGSPEVAAVGDVPRKAASKRLTAGRHTFALEYARGRWHRALNAFGLYVSGPGSIRTRLSADGSDPNDVWAAFKVEPGEKARLQRSFVMHPSGEKVHAISVGYPNGNHYAYDSETGALLHVWRGRFIDTSTMWFSRGNDQLAAPQGSLIEFSGRPTVAMEFASMKGATEDKTTSTESSSADAVAPPPGFKFGSYRLDQDGSPTFTYSVDGFSITDAIKPDEGGRFFTRTLTIDGKDDAPCPLRLADAKWMSEVSEGVFVIDNGSYQIEVIEGSAKIIEADGVMQLIANASNTVKVNIVW